MQGVRIQTKKSHSSGSGCVGLKGFLAWQVYDFAIYVNTPDDAHVSDSIVADSGIGVFTLQHAPPGLSHVLEENKVREESFVQCTLDIATGLRHRGLRSL